MEIKSYTTHVVTPEESLLKIITQHIPHIPEKSVLVITSKILSVCQNRIISKKAIADKFQLIQQEADLYLEGDYIKNYGVCLTIKNGILIPTAGIDESNSDDHYILYPLNIQAEAEMLWKSLKEVYHCNAMGILITDSHTTPLRRGVTGIALGWCGFEPLYNYIGKPDIYGRPLRCTYMNILDSLATAAVFLMGEGNEQTPLALITDTEKIVFQDRPPTEEEIKSVSIPLEEDLYAPLIASVNWRKGGT
ncbi:MAG TPA: coenzyme F420-0:L-glutamate ligase [Gammaproteobacteria bacterium]|nr:coenzyme F420-0:L-glutamate ligase [Gammaproteobacteria bacterium]